MHNFLKSKSSYILFPLPKLLLSCPQNLVFRQEKVKRKAFLPVAWCFTETRDLLEVARIYRTIPPIVTQHFCLIPHAQSLSEIIIRRTQEAFNNTTQPRQSSRLPLKMQRCKQAKREGDLYSICLTISHSPKFVTFSRNEIQLTDPKSARMRNTLFDDPTKVQFRTAAGQWKKRSRKSTIETLHHKM